MDGPVVPVIARVDAERDAAVATALPSDASLPIERLIARLQSALRVRALHATVLRRMAWSLRRRENYRQSRQATRSRTPPC